MIWTQVLIFLCQMASSPTGRFFIFQFLKLCLFGSTYGVHSLSLETQTNIMSSTSVKKLHHSQRPFMITSWEHGKLYIRQLTMTHPSNDIKQWCRSYNKFQLVKEPEETLNRTSLSCHPPFPAKAQRMSQKRWEECKSWTMGKGVCAM